MSSEKISYIGRIMTGIITDKNDKYYYVQRSGITYALNANEGKFNIGDVVEGFSYPNQKGTKCITTKIPKCQIGRYSFATVTGVRKDLGVFLDIGLPDKDIVLSCDELPELGQLWPKKGDQLMISLLKDKKDRLWGHLADESIFHAIARLGNNSLKNQNITGRVFRLKLAGTYFLTDDYYIGFIHPSERFEEPRLGEKINGRVIGIRPDGVLNCSLKPRGYEVIDDDANMILAMLNQTVDKKLPYTDKSTPEDINNKFAISKSQFKRALGKLMKQDKIYQKDGYTYLK